MLLLDPVLRRLIQRGTLTIIDEKGKNHRYGATAAEVAPVTMRFHDKRVANAIVRCPELGVAEGYMDGRITFDEGDILDLITLAGVNERFENGAPHKQTVDWRGIRHWLKARNHEARSKRNVAHHYDLGNPLYRLFLDADMQYSCAYFSDPANDLEQAQQDKCAHIAAKLFLKEGQRVLDIGCGWGGMALYLHKHYGVEVLGVTLSEEQLALARERAAAAGVSDKVRFELLDYRRVEGQFDRIVSVGMFEHVGAAHYDEFFAQVRRLLKPDGVMLLHTIGRFDVPATGDPFADKYIFPGYHLPSLSQMLRASEKSRLIASDVETLRLHYAYTLRHWIKRAHEHRADIVALYDERFFRMWEVYLAGATAMFESGAGCNYQVQYIRDRNAVPITRNYMVQEEQRLTG